MVQKVGVKKIIKKVEKKVMVKNRGKNKVGVKEYHHKS